MQGFSNFYKGIIGFGNYLQPFILLILRLHWGFAFFQTGWGKLNNIPNVAGFFSELGIPFPLLNAYLVGGIETIGGLCLLFGFASRLAAIPLAVTMIVALLTAHFDATAALFSSFGTIHQNIELVMENAKAFIGQSPFNYLMTSLIILAFGPGVISVDYVIERMSAPTSKRR